MNFISKIRNAIFRQSHKKFIDNEFNQVVLLFSITTYLDYEIKDIELINADSQLDKYLKKKFPYLKLKKRRELLDYAHELYIKNLIDFKKNKNYFQSKCNETIPFFENHKNEELIDSINEIINSDGSITKEESLFLDRIKKASSEK